ncbi:Hypothetical protein GLP15_4187 [Giardia lamblia P15]|uniref:Uncharacterized protein n=1 Tax=Giardia intestinalis (strain P15) TaxID=658858 RepID=E1EYF7_GIAIA|nr:Hypothetical protein GLP15_4187 [Giardia lamblia P15]
MLGFPWLASCAFLSVFISFHSEIVKLEPLSNMSLKTTLTLPLPTSKTLLSISQIKLTFPHPHGSVFTTLKPFDGTLESSSNSLQLTFSCQSPNSVNNCTVLVSELFSQNSPLVDISLDLITPEYSILFSKCTLDMDSSGVVAWKSSITTFSSDSSLVANISMSSSTSVSACNGFTISYDTKSFMCTPASNSLPVTEIGDKKLSISLTAVNCPELPRHIKGMQKARAILYSCTCTVSGSGSTSQSLVPFTVLELRKPLNVGIILLDVFFVIGIIACIVLIIVGVMKFREPNSCKCLSKSCTRKRMHSSTLEDKRGQTLASIPGTNDTFSVVEPSVLGEIRSDNDIAQMSHHIATNRSKLLSTNRVS